MLPDLKLSITRTSHYLGTPPGQCVFLRRDLLHFVGIAIVCAAMPADRGELELIERVNRGEEAAWAEVFERHHAWVYHQAMRLTRDADDASDIAQEAFMQLFSRIPGFQLTSALRTFFYGVVENRCLKRRDRLRKHVDIDDEALQEFPATENESEAHDAELLLVQLSPDQQSLLRLRYTDDLSVPQMAALLNTAEGTIKSRLARATQALRELAGAPMRRRA